MSYKILIPPDLPLDQHAQYAAAAIESFEARQAKRAAEQAERKQKEQAIKDGLALIAAENKLRDEKKLEAQRKRDEQSFEDSLRTAFFEASPMASESDWNKAKADLRAAALQERALAQLRGRETLVEVNKQILLKRSGRYSL